MDKEQEVVDECIKIIKEQIEVFRVDINKIMRQLPNASALEVFLRVVVEEVLTMIAINNSISGGTSDQIKDKLTKYVSELIPKALKRNEDLSEVTDMVKKIIGS